MGMKRSSITLIVTLSLAGCAASAATPGSASDPGAPPSGCHYRGSGVYALPDPRCSPGVTNPDVTQENIDVTICKRGWTATVRPSQRVTGPEKRAEFRAYDVRVPLRADELDHLVSLELGGAPNSYANYWPEPGASPNAKDRLEGVLRRRVCAGQMSLAAAQHAIASDWVTAYRQFVKKASHAR